MGWFKRSRTLLHNWTMSMEKNPDISRPASIDATKVAIIKERFEDNLCGLDATGKDGVGSIVYSGPRCQDSFRRGFYPLGWRPTKNCR